MVSSAKQEVHRQNFVVNIFWSTFVSGTDGEGPAARPTLSLHVSRRAGHERRRRTCSRHVSSFFKMDDGNNHGFY
jgi:hypothetical protein